MKRFMSLVAITMVALGLMACGADVPPSQQGTGNNQIEIPLFK